MVKIVTDGNVNRSKAKEEVKMQQAMYFLDQKDMPTHWYNILADLPEPLPPGFNPITKEIPPNLLTRGR